MRLADIQRLVGLTEKHVAMTAFDEARELVYSNDRPEHITEAIMNISDVVYEMGDRLGIPVTPNVRQLATLVWLTAEMFPQTATALANEQLINLPREDNL